MKNLIIILFSGIFIVACKKERTCTCRLDKSYSTKQIDGTYSKPDHSAAEHTTVEKTTKKNAKNLCKDRTWVEYYGDYAMAEFSSYKCKLN